MILRHLCVCDRERIFASFVLLLKGSLKPSSDYRIGRLYLGKESKFCFFRIFSKTIIEAFRPGHSISRGWPSKCRYNSQEGFYCKNSYYGENSTCKACTQTVHFICCNLCTLSAWTEGSTSALYMLHIVYTMNSEWRKGLPVHFTCGILCTSCAHALSRVLYRYTT